MSFSMSFNDLTGDLLVSVHDRLVDVLERVSKSLTPASVKALFVVFREGLLIDRNVDPCIDTIFPHLEELHIFAGGNRSFSGLYLPRKSGSWRVLTLELGGGALLVTNTRLSVEQLYLTTRGHFDWSEHRRQLDGLVAASARTTVLSELISGVPEGVELNFQPSMDRDLLKSCEWPFDCELLLPGTFARVPPLPSDLVYRVSSLLK